MHRDYLANSSHDIVSLNTDGTHMQRDHLFTRFRVNLGTSSSLNRTSMTQSEQEQPLRLGIMNGVGTFCFFQFILRLRRQRLLLLRRFWRRMTGSFRREGRFDGLDAFLRRLTGFHLRRGFRLDPWVLPGSRSGTRRMFRFQRE